MTEPTKKDYEALAQFRKTLRQFLRFTERTAREAGVTPQQHQVLLAAMGQPDREWATVGEIQEALQTEHHTAVGLIDRCHAAGLLARESDGRDRRVVRVVPTEKGKRMLAEVTGKNLVELRALERLVRDLERLQARS